MTVGDPARATVKALVFDVFGTVVDWRGSVVRELTAVGRAKGIDGDWSAFADEWRRDGYAGAIGRIRRGELAYTDVDTLHRRKLDELLPRHGLGGLSEAEVVHLNRAWHRLTPWPDAVAGLTRLKATFVISPLSNGTLALLTNMAKHSGLPWDCVLSAELFDGYKPDPKVYRGAARLLGLETSQLMMVAAHVGDLQAARIEGLRTAFVHRPREWGEGGRQEPTPDPTFDAIANDFIDLATQLGA